MMKLDQLAEVLGLRPHAKGFPSGQVAIVH